MKQFWKHVDRGEPNECWQWQGTVTGGYGMVKFKPYRNVGAHRVAFILDRGRKPEERYICHTCDNKTCVNPAHLYEGSPGDNMQDAVDKGIIADTRAKGEDANKSNLDADDVRDIRQRYKTDDVSQTELADEYGVTASAVSQIIHRKNWQHVD